MKSPLSSLSHYLGGSNNKYVEESSLTTNVNSSELCYTVTNPNTLYINNGRAD